jgi:prepilin-type processing-associated H-X9-DG protein
LATYIYRNAQFPLELNPTTSVAGAMDVSAAKIGDERLRNRVLLTDYWAGYTGSLTDPSYSRIPHGGTSVNLLWTDGHASSWKLPTGVLPIWGWYGISEYTEASFAQTFYGQSPWWWVVADRSGR